MNLMRFVLFLFTIPFFILLIKCNQPLEPTNDNIPYSQRNIGDIRQYVFSDDSSTWTFEVVGKTKRTDGQDVFIVLSTQGTNPPDTNYNFVKDGYLISTYLDSMDTINNESNRKYFKNPFYEQRLAEIFPKEGNTWVNTDGNPDMYWITNKQTSFQAMCSTFTEIVAFDLYDTNGLMLTAYYARGLDWVGSIAKRSTHFSTSCCYMKINGYEIGVLRPAKDQTLNHGLEKTYLINTPKKYINEFGKTKFK